MSTTKFQTNGVLASHHQGVNTYYKVQYTISEEAGRPDLAWIDSFGWAKEKITEEEFQELKGEMVMPENPLANNGFFNLKLNKMQAVGNFTSTEDRQTTVMLEGEWTSLQDPQIAFEILKEYINDDELNETDRWFDIEEDEDGRKFATSGTVDLEYYIEIN